MSIKIMSQCWMVSGISPPQKLVLLALADHADDAGLCWPSAATISERTGLSESTTRRAIAELEKLGHLTRKYQTGRPTYYSINPCHSDTPVTVTPLSEKLQTPVTVTPTPVREANDPCQRSKYNHHESSLIIIEPSLVKNEHVDTKKPTVENLYNTPDYLVDAFGVDYQIARDWIAVRKHKKSPPLSETSLKLLITEARKAGITPAQAIANAAGSGWISFKASYIDGNRQPAQNTAAGAGRDQW